MRGRVTEERNGQSPATGKERDMEDDRMETYLSQCYHLESILSGGD